MRQRIIPCLVLILALTVPAAGWAKSAELDPNGADLVAQGTGDATSGSSLFHELLAWFQATLLRI